MSLARSSSSSDLSTSLEAAVKYLFQYGGVLLVIFGNLGCILNILVFTKKTLRKNPCSTYFITSNIFNILLLNCLFLTMILQTAFNIPLTTKSTILCRLTSFISISSNAISTYCLILASIDRVLITSSNASTRQRSKYQLSYIYVIIGTIVWMLFHSPALVFRDIIQINEDISICLYQPGFYSTFASYYSLIKESLSSLLLLIFGLWTIRNIRRLRRAVLPRVSLRSGIVRQNNNTYPIQSKDRQFVFMVLMDIFIFSICSSTVAIFLTRDQITQYQIKSVDEIKINAFLVYMSIFFLHIPFGISCYTNLIVSKAYRNAIRNICSRN